MDKKNDKTIINITENKEQLNEPQKEYTELSNILNYQGNFLKDTQAKIAEISNYLKKFKILDDPQYYQSSKEYSSLIKSTKLRLEKLIFQTLFYTNGKLKVEDFKIKEYLSLKFTITN